MQKELIRTKFNESTNQLINTEIHNNSRENRTMFKQHLPIYNSHSKQSYRKNNEYILEIYLHVNCMKYCTRIIEDVRIMTYVAYTDQI